MSAALRAIPSSFRKLIVNQTKPLLKDAVEIITQPVIPTGVKEVLVKNKFIGINAYDVMRKKIAESHNLQIPTNLSYEGVGEIVDFGDDVLDIKCGQSVMYMGTNTNDAFSEYVYLPEKEVVPIISPSPNFLPLLISGTTASLSLDKTGNIIPGENVLITTAAGDIGHIAVQWAKNAGCHVIGMCESNEKVDFLKNLGCHRPLNYKEESLEDVLTSEYPNGVDVILVTFRENIYENLSKYLAIKGRLVIASPFNVNLAEKLSHENYQSLAIKLLECSSSISGFQLNHFKSDIPHYLTLLFKEFLEEKLTVEIDDGSSSGTSFEGLQDIPRAIEYLSSGKNTGKVVVAL